MHRIDPTDLIFFAPSELHKDELDKLDKLASWPRRFSSLVADWLNGLRTWEKDGKGMLKFQKSIKSIKSAYQNSHTMQ